MAVSFLSKQHESGNIFKAGWEVGRNASGLDRLQKWHDTHRWGRVDEPFLSSFFGRGFLIAKFLESSWDRPFWFVASQTSNLSKLNKSLSIAWYRDTGDVQLVQRSQCFGQNLCVWWFCWQKPNRWIWETGFLAICISWFKMRHEAEIILPHLMFVL